MSTFNKSVPGNTPQGKEEKTLDNGNGVRRTESAGVEYGLGMREGFDSGTAEASPDQNFKVDPLTGMATERLDPRSAKSVPSKDGKCWMIG